MCAVNICFHHRINEVVVDPDRITKYAQSAQTIEDLFAELKEGPIVGHGWHGPGAYVSEAVELEQEVLEQPLFGWIAGTQRKVSSHCFFIVLGASKKDGREYVYFCMSEAVTQGRRLDVQKHQPIDAKIYVVTHKTFRTYLHFLHPRACLQSEFNDPTEQAYIVRLSAGPLSRCSGPEGGEFKAMCRQIGEEIYEKFGPERMQRILDQLGVLRSYSVAVAWKGIGGRTYEPKAVWHPNAAYAVLEFHPR